MKIGLVLDDRIDRPGGVQEYVKGLYDYLTRSGNRVKIITCGVKKPSKGEIKLSGREIISLGKSIDIKSKSRGTQTSVPITWVSAKKIKQILETERFDVLHFQAPFGLLSMRFLDHSKTINVATFLTFWEPKILQPMDKIKQFFRHFSKKLHGSIAISSAAREFAQTLSPGDYRIIPMGIDLTRFNKRITRRKEFDDDKLNILFVGRLDRRKGLIYLLEAYEQLKKKFKKIRLIIVGKGPENNTIKNYIKKHGLEDVELVGFIPDKDLPRYYASAHIFCSPATHGESFGLVLLEAMASGLPIVAFSNPGYKEVIKGRVRRFLVPPRNVIALTRALEILIKDKNLREEMSFWSLREIQKYSWDKVGKEILDFYSQVSKK